jgi:hypothetical protein
MLADAYVVPVRGLQGKQRFFNVLKLLKQRKVTFCEAVYLMQPEKVTEDERRVLKLVMQTPLSVAELIRCFENSVRDVSSADKVIAAIYTDESDNRQSEQSSSSLITGARGWSNRNLYLTPKLFRTRIIKRQKLHGSWALLFRRAKNPPNHSDAVKQRTRKGKLLWKCRHPLQSNLQKIVIALTSNTILGHSDWNRMWI